jgi:hypothetical protein
VEAGERLSEVEGLPPVSSSGPVQGSGYPSDSTHQCRTRVVPLFGRLVIGPRRPSDLANIVDSSQGVDTQGERSLGCLLEKSISPGPPMTVGHATELDRFGTGP